MRIKTKETSRMCRFLTHPLFRTDRYEKAKKSRFQWKADANEVFTLSLLGILNTLIGLELEV